MEGGSPAVWQMSGYGWMKRQLAEVIKSLPLR